MHAGPANANPSGLTGRERAALARMVYLLFPHEGLPPRVYEQAGDFFSGRYAADPDAVFLLTAGVRMLEGHSGTSWLDRSADEQLARLHEIQDTEFFRLLRNGAIEYLYRDPRVWEMLGYEGPSIRFGGYLNRGLADVDWLPGT